MPKRFVCTILFVAATLFAVAQDGLTVYEYWIDSDYNGRVMGVGSGESITLSIGIPNLSSGFHYYNIRCQNTEGVWGPLYRYVFFIPESIPITTLTYWIDNETDIKTWKGEGNTFVVQADISHLNAGRHVFHYQMLNDEASSEYSNEFIISDINEIDFDGLVLTANGDVTMAEALEQVGGLDSVASTVAAVVWNSSQPLTHNDLQGIDNPNLLVYVKDASLAPANINNVVINGQAKSIVLTDVAEGNNNFYCPQPFTTGIVSYTREFHQDTQVGVSRGWESIAMPFTVQAITHEVNAALKPFGAGDNGKPFWLRKLGDNGLTQATRIEANVPYVISMPNNSEEYPAEYNQAGKVTFSAENVTIPATAPVTLATANKTLLMIPAFQRVGKSSDVWAINVGEARGQYYEGSVFERDYREVRPFEAYTVHKNINPAPRFMSIDGMSTTGITIISIDNESESANHWFTVDGRELLGKPTAKGIYITKGKKVVIK